MAATTVYGRMLARTRPVVVDAIPDALCKAARQWPGEADDSASQCRHSGANPARWGGSQRACAKGFSLFLSLYFTHRVIIIMHISYTGRYPEEYTHRLGDNCAACARYVSRLASSSDSMAASSEELCSRARRSASSVI